MKRGQVKDAKEPAPPGTHGLCSTSLRAVPLHPWDFVSGDLVSRILYPGGTGYLEAGMFARPVSARPVSGLGTCFLPVPFRGRKVRLLGR